MLAPLLFGIGLGDLLAGLPIDAAGDFTGTFLDLLTPYGLFLGLTLLLLCLLHGSTFLSIRSTGRSWHRAQGMARRLAMPGRRAGRRLRGLDIRAGPAGRLGDLALAVPLAAVVAAAAWCSAAGPAAGRSRRPRSTIGGTVASLFANLYPNAADLHHRPGNTLTVANSTASRVLAAGDDDRRGGDGSAGAAVPGLDLLRVPPAGSSAPHRRRPDPDRADNVAARMKSLTRVTPVTKLARSDPRRRT